MREGFATLEEAAAAIAAYLPQSASSPVRWRDLAKNLRQDSDGRYRWHWDPAFIDGPRNINTGAETVQQRLVRSRAAAVHPGAAGSWTAVRTGDERRPSRRFAR
jgi:hypothetical protein